MVLGEKSAVSRAEAAAKLLDQGFATPTTGSTTVATLASYGDTLAVNDMQDVICKKKAAEEQSEAPPPVAKKDAPKSLYQQKLDHVPALVAVGLGGATGPAPKALLAQSSQEYADVPLPVWRPDRPAPAGADPIVSGAVAVQGDQPAKN